MIEGAAGAFGGAPVGGVEIFGIAGVQIWAIMVRAEFHIGYGEAHLQKHGLVKGLDFPDLSRQGYGTAPEGRATRGTEAGGPFRRNGGVSEANSRKGKAHLPSDILLSLGGGTLTDEGSRELVKKNCKCIYLRASVETLAANLREVGTEGRPMLAGANPDAPADAPDSLESRIAAMMAERGPIYEKAADIIRDIDGLSYEQAARQILNSFSR